MGGEQPQKVDSLSGGRIAYVYLPNTADGGYDYFNRYFFSQLNKDAVIADDRTNMGGYAADYIVDLLGRKTVMYSNQRDNKPFSIPNAVINGPKVMLINPMRCPVATLCPTCSAQRKWVNSLAQPLLVSS